MADLFGEVEQDLRAEQARTMVKRYGVVVLLIIIVAAAGAGIWQYLNWQQQKAEARLSGAYFNALQSLNQPGVNDPATQAQKTLPLFRPLTTSGAAGVRSLSRLRMATVESDAGNTKGAIADLDALASDSQAPGPLRDLATLASVQRQLQTGTPAELALRLQGIEQLNSPFRALALETSAMIDLSSGKLDQARQVLRTLLADENATEAIRERANTLLQAISPAAGG